MKFHNTFPIALACTMAVTYSMAALAQEKSTYLDLSEWDRYNRVTEFAIVMEWHDCRLSPEKRMEVMPKEGFSDPKEHDYIIGVLKEEGRLTIEGEDIVLHDPACASPEEVRDILLAALAKQGCKVPYAEFKPFVKKLALDPRLARKTIQTMLKNGEATVNQETHELTASASVCG